MNHQAIEEAAGRIEGFANRTPVMTSRTVDERVGARVFFKCENFQRAGAFKFRGACNAMLQLSDDEKQRGVLTYSSGNHAQAIALAGKLFGIPATIIMPDDAPEVKVAATRGYGAHVILYDRNETTREALGKQLAEEQGLSMIPPYDDERIVAGQGTTALELIRETGPLDTLLVCCGGGGLLSGCAVAAKHLCPGIKVVGVEPAQADDACRSFETKTLQTVHTPDTIADGARTPSLGAITFPLVLEHVDVMVRVSEREIVESMFFLWERMKLVVEPTGALAAAAVLTGKVPIKGRVGVVISGGNVDLKDATRLFATV